jgi:hypothetical protein
MQKINNVHSIYTFVSLDIYLHFCYHHNSSYDPLSFSNHSLHLSPSPSTIKLLERCMCAHGFHHFQFLTYLLISPIILGLDALVY